MPTDTETTPTDELPTTPTPAETRRPARTNAIAGVLTGVLVIMGVGMLVAQIVSAVNGQPGPGALAVGAHLAGAVIGVCCYQVAIRRTGRLKVAALVVLPLVIVVLTWVFWLSPS